MAPRAWRISPQLESPREGLVLGPGYGPGADAVWIGTLAEVLKGGIPRVWLSTAKEQVVAVVGKRGSGKSFTLGVILEGVCSRESRDTFSRQEHPRGALLFDPLDVYWTTRFPVVPSDNEQANEHFELARRAGLEHLSFTVSAWIPGRENTRDSDPEWFRVLELPLSEISLDEWQLLLEVNALTDPMGQALVDVLSLSREEGYTVDGRAYSPNASSDLDDLITATAADSLLSAYHRETLRALRQRLSSLRATGLFGAVGTPIAELVRPGQLSVIMLSRLPTAYQSAVVAVVTRMLMESRSASAFAEKRLALDPDVTLSDKSALAAIADSSAPRTIVALDEAQAFLAPDSSGPARALFVRLVKEGRNLGLSAILATQQPSALDRRVLSQIETFVSHQLVTETDIKAVRDNLKSGLPDVVEFGPAKLTFSDLIRGLPPGYAVVSASEMNTRTRRAIVMQVRPRATVHGGIEL